MRRFATARAVLTLCLLLIASCGGQSAERARQEGVAEGAGETGTESSEEGAEGKEGKAMAFALTSPAFKEGETIPTKYTCDGPDLSPPLKWTDPPEGTKAFALICDDPDAPVGTWVHWVIFGIPAATRELPEGVAKTDTLADGSCQGRNDFRRSGYGGPCPPKGPAHRYYFRLYAVDSEITLKAGATKKDVLDAIKGHTLTEAALMGRYSRS